MPTILSIGDGGGTTTNWTVITDLGVEGDATVAPGVMTLQGMNTGLAGNYVLGTDIAASGTSTWNTNAGFVPVGANGSSFTGSFDGLGHTVTGLTINRQVNVAGNFYQGLFGYSTGSLRNVGMLNSNIAGASVVGALAGYSGGSISYSYADGGSVSASVHQAGGLVGQLGGSISNSYANVSVSGTDYACCFGGVASSNIGGLVGKTLDGSSISNSYSTGSVNGSTYVGGLVGQNRGDIDTSYASGAVTKDGGLSRAGGLIGDHLKSFLTPLTVTATSGSKIYDGTASGLGVSYSTAPNANLLGTAVTTSASSNVGTWAVSASGLYSNQSGYDITYVAGALTIDPVPIVLLGVGADNQSKTYGSADPVLTYTVGSGNLAPGDSFSGSMVRDPGENVGSYAIRQGTLSISGNYIISFVDGTLSISPAPLTVTANNAAKAYDGLAYTGGNGVVYSGFVNGETAAVLGGALIWGGSAQGAVNAGSYAIAPSGLTSGNYTIGYVDGMLTVDAVPLTVTANDFARTYDAQIWSGGNGVSYSGFVNGETAAVLGGALTWGGSAQGAVDPGSYVIAPSGLTSGNYVITFVDGVLFIGERIPAVPGAPVDGYAASTAGVLPAAADANGASSTKYALSMHECGLRLPAGVDCK